MIFARKMKRKDLQMTNEEAIRNIVAYMMVYTDYIPEDVGKAFDTAIKVLKERSKGKWINTDDFSEWLKEQKTGFDYNNSEVLVDRNGIWENAIETYLKEGVKKNEYRNT